MMATTASFGMVMMAMLPPCSILRGRFRRAMMAGLKRRQYAHRAAPSVIYDDSWCCLL